VASTSTTIRDCASVNDYGQLGHVARTTRDQEVGVHDCTVDDDQLTLQFLYPAAQDKDLAILGVVLGHRPLRLKALHTGLGTLGAPVLQLRMVDALST